MVVVDLDEIWSVSVDHVCTVSCQIWHESVRKHCHKSPPKYKNLVEIAIF